ncbi:gamma-type small acid-soluble spore protein [Lysinibacillus sp. 38-6]|uniref:gamma-type small acid-soluble spore protein n=1 Tax=Lysinibacillus sp. 38-6 TaxID=3385991 RepID=UPI003908893F
MNEEQLTASGTNINEVKRKNAEAGLSYNEVKELLAKTGGHGTAKYSDTNSEEVKADINQSWRNQ